jgi:hypothetical protein
MFASQTFEGLKVENLFYVIGVCMIHVPTDIPDLWVPLKLPTKLL